MSAVVTMRVEPERERRREAEPGTAKVSLEMAPPIDLDDETERLSPAGEDGEWWLLLVEEGRSVAHRLPRGKPISIGRGDDNDIRIDHASISRRHAQLLVGPPVCIQDLSSANGVRVARQPLAPMTLTPVEPGHAIELGAVLAVVHRPSMLPPGVVASSPSTDAAERPSMMPGGPALIRDPAMREVMDLAERVAPSQLTVLLLGETGVGKEVVAEAIHAASPRADGPLIRVNCAALAESIAESELFGHERGAFTGAIAERAGVFEAADGGTVFLDEVGELTPGLQAKLLRVLETREVTRVGSVQSKRVDVRFVSATNRDLRERASSGHFREDLYYRLNGIRIEIPSLRERPADILPLAKRFARQAQGGEAPELGAGLVDRLERYAWPGNVRELKNAMERAAVLAGGGRIEVSHLPEEIGGGLRRASTRAAAPDPASLRNELEGLERQRIVDALATTGGNQTKAAELLGMPRRTFVKRLDAYGIERPRKKSGGRA